VKIRCSNEFSLQKALTAAGMGAVTEQMKPDCTSTTMRQVVGKTSADVVAASELLWLDPLYITSEGRLLAVISVECAGDVMAAMRLMCCGRHSPADPNRLGRVLSVL